MKKLLPFLTYETRNVVAIERCKEITQLQHNANILSGKKSASLKRARYSQHNEEDMQILYSNSANGGFEI